MKKKKDAEWESFAKELRDLIPQLDSEGLAFLVEQARVHLYNLQVEELNKAAAAANTASAKAAGLMRGQKTAKQGKESFKILGSESGSSYYLHYRNDNVMFNRGEMTHIVKIVNGPGTEIEIRERLYKWFERERKDIFALVPMPDKFDERLKAIVALIKKSFKF